MISGVPLVSGFSHDENLADEIPLIKSVTVEFSEEKGGSMQSSMRESTASTVRGNIHRRTFV